MNTRSLILVPLALCLVWPAVAAAQPPEDNELPPALDPELAGGYDPGDDEDTGPSQPPRIVITGGAGASLRLIQNFDFVQDRFAPAFLDVFGAFVFGGRGMYRHGVGAGLSLNMTGDGNEAVGVDPFQQIVATPAYLAYLRLSDDFTAAGKVGVPLAMSPDFVPGVEIAGSFTMLLLAGFGLYAELTFSAFFGGDDSFHPLVSAEGGVAFDYELLP